MRATLKEALGCAVVRDVVLAKDPPGWWRDRPGFVLSGFDIWSGEKLWSVGQVEIAGKPIAWSAAVNWLATGDDAKQCEWKADRFSGFFVAGADGAPVKVTEGQEHALPLFAVLADGGGPKIVLASGPGEYSAYDYAGGKVAAGRHLVWLRPHPDSWDEIDHLGPVCP